MNGYDGLSAYFGDIHNHCAVGYGHGSLEDALTNARLQLDFACVTPHAHWPDMPTGDPALADVVAYHEMGFARAAAAWPDVQDQVQAANLDSRFVTFLGFEWHSMQYGDHCIYYRDGRGDILRAPDLDTMRAALRALAQRGVAALLLPHHIGYRQGYRGINWATFTPEFSPVVEIMSMHGASESGDAPYPYLHTMGPRDGRSAYRHGLAAGHIVGVMGSTDHHSAHPGSYGSGRLGVWAESLSRAAIWDAICQRRTVALTGDNIRARFSLNGAPLGSVLAFTPEREARIDVTGGGTIREIELVHNGETIHRWHTPHLASPNWDAPCKVAVEVGWAERDVNVDWAVDLAVENGDLVSVEPRFRGHSIVAPSAAEQDSYQFSRWARVGPDGLRLETRTWGNPTGTTANTQGVCLEVRGGPGTRLSGRINGKPVTITLADLAEGPHSDYLGGFLTPAYCFHAAAPHHSYHLAGSFSHRGTGDRPDWYMLRIGQHNGQWAWTSPIWVRGRGDVAGRG
ncbi:MAG: hypothetical protein IT323_15635 [Anaerolineae bacterium]|nr:hypothetical protein [Anaerolineae bacterium]